MPDAGNISVRFTVANAEVVRQALSNLGKDGERALKQFDSSAQPATKSMTMLSDIVEQMKGRAAGFASQGGLVGNALVRWGPAGLAAGAALGGVYLAISQLNEQAERFAAKAQGFRDSAAAISLNTTQYQALVDAGGKVGIAGEQVAKSLAQVGASALEARDAQGSLFDTIRKVSPELADQLLVARDTGRVMDIVAQAYARAATSSERLAVAKLVGKDPNIGNFLSQINAAGGVNAMTEAFKPEAIPDATIERVSKLNTEIKQIKENTSNIWGGMFVESTLQGQRASATLWNEIARDVKAFFDNLDRRNTITAPYVYTPGSEFGTLPDRAADQIEAQGAEMRSRRLDELGKKQKKINEDLEYYRRMAAAPDNAWPDQDIRRAGVLEKRLEAVNKEMATLKGQDKVPTVVISKPAEDVPLPTARPKIEGDSTVKRSALAELNLFREKIALLGQAATPQEQYELREKEIAAAVERGGVAEDTRRRALAGANLARDQAIAGMRERLGIEAQSEMLATRLRELDNLQAKGFIRNAEERAAAERIVRKEVTESANAVAVRASSTPALTQLSQEAGDLTKMLDTGLAGAMRGVASEFSLFNNTSASTADRLKNIALRFADVALQAAIMNTFVKPASSLLSAAFSIFGSADGNVFEHGSIRPFARGGIIDRPILFPMANGAGLAGEAGPEAIVPLSRDSRGRLGVNASGRGGTTIEQNIYVSGATGNEEVHRMVAAGVQTANQQAANMLSDYNVNVLPHRLPEIQERNL